MRYSIVCVCIHTYWRRQWHPTPVLLPGKSHGWRSLAGYNPWGCEESDMTERLHFHFSLSCTGEGNGNPLQCSCLENPWDGGAWWATVYGVTQNRTLSKRLSSSSSIHTYIYIYILIFFSIMVYHKVLTIDYCFLCYTIRSCCLSILYITVCTCKF